MKRNYVILGLIALIAIMLAIFFMTKGSQKKGRKINTEKVVQRTIVETVSASGKIFPETEVKISSDVSGEIVELYVEEGDSVKAGKLLVRVNPDTYKSVVERAEAAVNTAKAQEANSKTTIAQANAQKQQLIAQKSQIQAQLENAKSVHARNKTLHKEGIISDADFDASLSTLRALEANIASAEASVNSADASIEASKQSVKAAEFGVKSASASLKEAKENLNKTAIYAPNSGIVSLLNVKKGERVVGTLQMAGTEIMRIANMSAMEVQVEVTENDVVRVKVGDETDIEVDAYLGRTFKGTVTQISNSSNDISSSLGTVSLTSDQVTNFTVKIRIDPASYKDLMTPGNNFPFRPGMSASVSIRTNTKEDILCLPIAAVSTREKKDLPVYKDLESQSEKEEIVEIVFIVNNEKAFIREVKTGIQDDDYIEIISGLEVEEEVVTAPYSAISKKLDDEDLINVVSEDELYKNPEKDND